MKLLLASLLMLGMASTVLAADPVAPAATPKKETAAAKAKAEKPKADKPKEKAPKEPSAKDKALADSLSAAQKTKLLDILNTGDEKAIIALPGVGVVRSVAIKASRPYKEPTDLLNVMGIGEATYAGIIKYAKADFTEAPKTKAPAKKADDKKTDDKAKK